MDESADEHDYKPVSEGSMTNLVPENEAGVVEEGTASDFGENVVKAVVQLKQQKKKKRWWKSRANISLLVMAVMVFSFFLVELFFGIFANSLALVSDAFHMISDLIALLVGVITRVLSTRGRDKRFTYGYKRVEVLGGLVNGVFLLSIVFYIIMEAIERLFEDIVVREPVLLIIVAFIGLLINILGLVLLGGSHGHDHGDHDHGHKDDHKHEKEEEDENCDHKEMEMMADDLHVIELTTTGEDLEEAHGVKNIGKKFKKQNLALRGVFLHVMGDALGSVAVLFTGVMFLIFDHPWVYYFDPFVSLIICGILLRTTIPHVIRCAKVFLQTVPDNVDMSLLTKEIETIHGVLGLHDLHVWNLADLRLVATCHVVMMTETGELKTEEILAAVKKTFHKHDIHATTIQVEKQYVVHEKFDIPEGEDHSFVCAYPCDCDEDSNLLCCEQQRSPFPEPAEGVRNRSKRGPIVEDEKSS